MTAVAPHHQRAFCKVIIAGEDVTTRLNPRLLSLIVLNKFDGVDEAHIELDDRYGQIKMPEDQDQIEIELGWPEEGSFLVFKGVVQDLESAGQKRGGRTMTIIAFETDLLKHVKTQMRWSEGDGTEDVKLDKALQTAAGLANMNVKVSPALAQLSRKYFMGQNESFMAFGKRMAGEVGGVFKMSGDSATLSKPGENADGESMGEATATVGANLIAWRVRPRIARAKWAAAGHMHFDPMKAAWDLVKSDVSGGGTFSALAKFTGVGPQADKDTSQQQADSDAVSSRENAGTGWVVVDGNPQARPNGKVTIVGARNGVDGSYLITDVEHNYSAQQGYTTRIDFINS